MTPTVFITPCLKNARASVVRWLARLLLYALSGMALAQGGNPEAPALKLERFDAGLWLSTQLNVALPAVVEDALQKGIPIYFVAQADLVRVRWYWTDKTIASVRRHLRLSYHPLTQRWRLNITPGSSSDASPGLVLNQNYETLGDAMAAVQRIFRWRIADLDDIEADKAYVVHFHFELDLGQLPRPLQIGTLGQSDWLVARSLSQPLEPEPAR